MVGVNFVEVIVEWFGLVDLGLIDDGFLVEFMDISEKNIFRIVSVFDIGEEVFLFYESWWLV